MLGTSCEAADWGGVSRLSSDLAASWSLLVQMFAVYVGPQARGKAHFHYSLAHTAASYTLSRWCATRSLLLTVDVVVVFVWLEGWSSMFAVVAWLEAITVACVWRTGARCSMLLTFTTVPLSHDAIMVKWAWLLWVWSTWVALSHRENIAKKIKGWKGLITV